MTRRVMSSCRNTFGETITYTPVGQSAVEIQAIVDEAFEAVDPDTGAIVIAEQPKIGVRLADLDNTPAKGDTCVVRGTTYNVISYQPDGQAAAVLLLHEASS